MCVTYSIAVDSSNDWLADVNHMSPVTQEVLLVSINILEVLHFLNISTSFHREKERKREG